MPFSNGLGELGLGELGLGEMGLGEMGGHRLELITACNNSWLVCLCTQYYTQWRSNGLFSMCKEQGPTSLRGPTRAELIF